MLGLNVCVDELAQEWLAACCLCCYLVFGILLRYHQGVAEHQQRELCNQESSRELGEVEASSGGV